MQIRQNQVWPWNSEEMSLEIKNRGTSGPKIGHVNVSDKEKYSLHLKKTIEYFK